MEVFECACTNCGKKIMGFTKTQVAHLLRVHKMGKKCKKVEA